MKYFTKIRCYTKHIVTILIFTIITSIVLGAAGAHGPDGEHLDSPTVNPSSVTTQPHLVAKSEQYELVALLKNNELVIFIDHYETNEPLLNAKLEIEIGELKAPAIFNAKNGNYVVSDAKLIKTLTYPGKHSLIFTIIAGNEADLLEGTLTTNNTTHEHNHAHKGTSLIWMSTGGVVLGLLGYFTWWRQCRYPLLTPKIAKKRGR